MKNLLFRIPTRKYLTETYNLSDTISLIPAGKFSAELGPATSFANSYWYVEKMSNQDKTLPLDNLKQFIRFWSFVFSEDLAVTHLEIEKEHPKAQQELPVQNIDTWQGHINPVFDPKKIHIEIEFAKSKKEYSLSDLYAGYLNAGYGLKSLIELYQTQLNRYVVNKIYALYDNYYLDSSLNCTIIDALTQEDRCCHKGECPNGCLNDGGVNKFDYSHPKISFRNRINGLLDKFEEKEHYTQIIMKYWKKRNKLIHKGFSDVRPATKIPDQNLLTGVRTRAATMEETLKNFDVEGLAAGNARVLFNSIIYTLLINKLYPDANLWPKFAMLKIIST